jgi:hypothetical protein
MYSHGVSLSLVHPRSQRCVVPYLHNNLVACANPSTILASGMGVQRGHPHSIDLVERHQCQINVDVDVDLDAQPVTFPSSWGIVRWSQQPDVSWPGL